MKVLLIDATPVPIGLAITTIGLVWEGAVLAVARTIGLPDHVIAEKLADVNHNLAFALAYLWPGKIPADFSYEALNLALFGNDDTSGILEIVQTMNDNGNTAIFIPPS